MQAAKSIDTQIKTSLKVPKKSKKVNKNSRYIALYIMLIPGILYYVIYKYIPMFGTIIAFKDYSLVKGIIRSPWANPWYKYFAQFFKSPYFTQLLSNTLILSFSKLIVNTLGSIILALFLNEVKSKFFKSFVQTVTYLPHFLSWVIVYGIIFSLFSESSGVINLLLKRYFGTTLPMLNSPDHFRWLLILSNAWKGCGWGAIIYLAAISGIDPGLYEAAAIDGANRFQRMWHVTLSGIRSSIIMMMILNCGHILSAGFDHIFVMYSIPVQSVSDIIDTWVYRTGLEQMNYSLGTAVGLFKSAVSFALILTVNKIAKRWGESMW